MLPEIPECLRRDRNNVAPFMRATERPKVELHGCLCRSQFERSHCAYDRNGECTRPKPDLVIGLDGQMSIGGQEVVGVVLSPLSGIGPEKTVLFNERPKVERKLIGYARTAPCANLSDSPQETSQDWVPPWVSKS